VSPTPAAASALAWSATATDLTGLSALITQPGWPRPSSTVKVARCPGLYETRCIAGCSVGAPASAQQPTDNRGEPAECGTVWIVGQPPRLDRRLRAVSTDHSELRLTVAEERRLPVTAMRDLGEVTRLGTRVRQCRRNACAIC
jgi:hypothetical protein